MRLNLWAAFVASLAMLCAGPALAANNITGKDAAAATITICTQDIGSSVHAPCAILVGGGIATTTLTRSANTTAYAANQTFANASATVGGDTLTGMCRASGGSGRIDSIVVVSTADPATTLVGEIWVLDSAGTAVNDNAAFAMSDADIVKLVGVVPFSLATTVAGSGTNSYYATPALGLAYTCSGTANLRFLVKVKNAYTPISGEALTVRANFIWTN